MFDLTLLLTLLIMGFVIGSIIEHRHYRSIERRERELLHIPITTTKTLPVPPDTVEAVASVSGSAVISVDYFKRFMSWLRNIFGGRVKAYESLLDRARREAMLRMREQTKDADYIINVRIETSSISKSSKKKRISCVEALAYGTAIRLHR